MWTLVILVELVIPLCLVSRIRFLGVTCKVCGFNISIIGAISCVLYLCLFGKLLYEQWLERGGPFELKLLIDLIVHYGVYLMALMSAYGAIWSPYLYYNMLNQKEIHRIANAKQKTQEEIHFIIEQTKNHKYELLKLSEKICKLKKEIEDDKLGESTVAKFFSRLTWNKKSREEDLKKL
jgi:hypothetical protein